MHATDSCWSGVFIDRCSCYVMFMFFFLPVVLIQFCGELALPNSVMYNIETLIL